MSRAGKNGFATHLFDHGTVHGGRTHLSMTILGSDNLDAKPDQRRDERAARRAATEVEALVPPAWARELVTGAHRPIWADCSAGLESAVTSGPRGTLVSVRFRDAVLAPAEVLEARTIEMYQLIRAAIAASENHWPVRVWNYIPNIHQPLDDERDRYMVFNSGRFKAYCDWFGGRENFPDRVPTASGVGHRGADLVIHCLAVEGRGISVENPRQIPAFGYSRRYGPQPPCFARGTVLHADPADGSHTLLIGGTASIRGEQSMYLDSLGQQADETLANLAALVRAAAARAQRDVARDDGDDDRDEKLTLATMRSLRVYHPRETDRNSIATTVARRFPNAAPADVEYLRADLCRAELLIEIEGVARF